MNYVALFFAGALLCNAIPHLTCGLRGAPFPTPFATPRGVGDSTPLVNVGWGFANLVAGLFVLSRHPIGLAFNPNLIALLAGGLTLGIYSSLHFGKVRRDKLSPCK